MPVYTALLRGINVGAHKRVKREKLRASCPGLGFEKVKTFIQSGNVVYQAAKLSSDSISRTMQQCIASDFGFSADVIMRSKDEMGSIVRDNPFLKQRGIDTKKLHVAFLSDPPATPAVKKLQSLTIAPDKIHPAGKEIYFYFPNGVSGSSLWEHSLDRVLGVPVTMRNWNTVNQLYEMAVGCG